MCGRAWPAKALAALPQNLHNFNSNKEILHKTSLLAMQMQCLNKISDSHSYHITTSKPHIMKIWSYYCF